MCWATKKIPVKQIAEEDIPVFKIVTQDSENFISIYKKYKYEKGKTYSSEIGEVEQLPKLYKINKGLHSYSNSCYTFITYSKSLLTTGKVLVVCGKDNYWLDTMPMYDYHLVKLDGIIPKGSEYYLNEKGEYVSSQIKIIDKCAGSVTVNQ